MQTVIPRDDKLAWHEDSDERIKPCDMQLKPMLYIKISANTWEPM